jgi:L-fucose isomerase-like protein
VNVISLRSALTYIDADVVFLLCNAIVAQYLNMTETMLHVKPALLLVGSALALDSASVVRIAATKLPLVVLVVLVLLTARMLVSIGRRPTGFLLVAHVTPAS